MHDIEEACDCLGCTDDRSLDQKMNDARMITDTAIADGIVSEDLREFYLGLAFADLEFAMLHMTVLKSGRPAWTVSKDELARRYVGMSGVLCGEELQTVWVALPSGQLNLEVTGPGSCVVERSWDAGKTPIAISRNGQIEAFGAGEYQLFTPEAGVLWRVRRIDGGSEPLFARLQAA